MSSRCLSCDEVMRLHPSWRGIFFLESEQRLCEQCEARFVRIDGQCCVRCSRPLMKAKECHDCLRWQEYRLTRDLLERNISLYEYNSFLKELLATYKYRGDAQLAKIFIPHMKAAYERHFANYLPVAIPLTRERLVARTFNQSLLLMEGWADDPDILIRLYGKKQSKRKRKERMQQINEEVFAIKQEKIPTINGENIVLIDDIYTTGTTVRQAALLLKKYGVKKVSSLTIAR